jgi:hypothetical protein
MVGDAPTVREKDDFYGTPAWVTERLLDRESFHERVWEPACGEGHISGVLQRHGHDVVKTDLVQRGAAQELHDFLLVRTRMGEAIVTNPPFKLAQEFVQHGLDLGVTKIAMLLKLSFSQSKQRTPWLMRSPLSRLLIVPERITFHAAKDRNPYRSSFMDSYAWFVWDRRHVGPATVGAI